MISRFNPEFKYRFNWDLSFSMSKGCNSLINATCPLVEGQSVTYKSSFLIIAPNANCDKSTISAYIKLELYSENDFNIVCAYVPITIKKLQVQKPPFCREK